MKCKEQEKIAFSLQILEPSLRRHAFKHKRDTSGRIPLYSRLHAYENCYAK